MKISVILLSLAGLLAFNSVQADIYVELSLEGGGDEIIGTNFGDSIDAGGGVKLAIGIQNPLTTDNAGAIRLTVGYLFDRIVADNGDAEFESLTFDALYVLNSGPHSLGVGATLHLSPVYADDLVDFPSLQIEFDDALGMLLQYGYKVMPGLEIGVRVTEIEYRSGFERYDAGSVGVYFSNGF